MLSGRRLVRTLLKGRAALRSKAASSLCSAAEASDTGGARMRDTTGRGLWSGHAEGTAGHEGASRGTDDTGVRRGECAGLGISPPRRSGPTLCHCRAAPSVCFPRPSLFVPSGFAGRSGSEAYKKGFRGPWIPETGQCYSASCASSACGASPCASSSAFSPSPL